MVRTWLTAAAAAGSLSSAIPTEITPTYPADHAETRTFAAPRSERDRILAIAGEVRRLVVRFGEEIDAKAVIAPRLLRDLGVDELALADVVLGLETRFGIDIGADEPARWATVGDVVGFVAQRVRETAAS